MSTTLRLSLAAVALFLALPNSFVQGTARLSGVKSIDAPRTLPRFSPQISDISLKDLKPASSVLTTAADRLQATYSSWLATESTQFPDVVDSATQTWHTDEVYSNGAAGLLAGSLWTMYTLTNDNQWRERALVATQALLPATSDKYLGQALGMLIYPAIRYAYEAETDASGKQVYLEAALTAASTLSKLYVRVSGVLKVRPTSDIASEARAAGAATVSPLAAFSSVEGSSAAASLLMWAASLPGGKTAWRDMALKNAQRLAADHIREDGSVLGTLMYKTNSATAKPQELSAVIPRLAGSVLDVTASSPLGSATSSVISSLFGVLNGGHTSTQKLSDAGVALDAWLSAVAGQETTPELRQAMATQTLAEAARATPCSEDADMLTAAAETTAVSLVSWASDEAAITSALPAAAAAAASALSALSTLPTVSTSQRALYRMTAAHVISVLAGSNLQAPAAASDSTEGPASIARRLWLSSFLSGASHGAAHHHSRLLRGVSSVEDSISKGEEVLVQFSAKSVAGNSHLPVSLLVNDEGKEGSMLADNLFLQAIATLKAGDM
ncbi:hypothetical protein CEUSTIGMA_g744.t1 [Chlamydomonas eustigma]|uniref:Uncharacterized protein n=1 Tax=Chlamydomonas eustigma TaxID=1157962 RepID=A0A250WRX0_9CHLO|nr:hypothetical protein CEUSTIGMA_g744.t1 [Chlamydomonas eustigma]|eukprot:GAX73290.1 hypothetical protein CEUSTIGMA_g744.t1 [Chlamydomonas eustigma]